MIKNILYVEDGSVDLERAIKFCKEELGIEFDYINSNTEYGIKKCEAVGGDCRKVACDYYIDDRNITVLEATIRGIFNLRRRIKK